MNSLLWKCCGRSSRAIAAARRGSVTKFCFTKLAVSDAPALHQPELHSPANSCSGIVYHRGAHGSGSITTDTSSLSMSTTISCPFWPILKMVLTYFEGVMPRRVSRE